MTVTTEMRWTPAMVPGPCSSLASIVAATRLQQWKRGGGIGSG